MKSKFFVFALRAERQVHETVKALAEENDRSINYMYNLLVKEGLKSLGQPMVPVDEGARV